MTHVYIRVSCAGSIYTCMWSAVHRSRHHITHLINLYNTHVHFSQTGGKEGLGVSESNMSQELFPAVVTSLRKSMTLCTERVATCVSGSTVEDSSAAITRPDMCAERQKLTLYMSCIHVHTLCACGIQSLVYMACVHACTNFLMII